MIIRVYICIDIKINYCFSFNSNHEYKFSPGLTKPQLR